MGFALAAILSFAGARYAQAEAPSLLVDDLDRESLRLATRRSLQFLERLPPERVVGELPRKVTARDVRDSLQLFLRGIGSIGDPQELSEWVKSNFDLYPTTPAAGRILFTGYYRPVLQASLAETRRFRYPIYGKPKDLIEAAVVTLVPERRVARVVGRLERDRWLPYFSRAEIDREGKLRGRGYELAWVDDPVERFFLHVQGFGVLILRSGESVGVTYAASNGRPYRSVGKALSDLGKIPIEEVTMQRLKRYLREHPEEREPLMETNERYVFFRFTKDGALGSLGVPLTPGRSVATDPRFYPQAALLFILTNEPELDWSGNPMGWRSVRRFVLGQDAGAAIQGPGRIDLYFGTGERAGSAAGVMKSAGAAYVLMKKAAPTQ
ncbi:MAG TPA: MltA domain-containing protein [Candidatus Acidoferrales bacterium]|nr:MltA domain-containing protein [Candidatus Acidoferrales bacterium]